MNAMKKVVIVVGLLGIVSGVVGCSYGGLATSGDKVVVLRNGLFTNTAYVCRVTDKGVTACSAGESP
jgi:hypothetical protein